MKVVNPKGPNKGTYRVFRGCSWLIHSDNLVVSGRYITAPSGAHSTFSFRVVCNGRKE